MKLLLWDIDGTVMRTGSVTRDAFSTAVERVLGFHPREHGVAMSGKTDPQILWEIFEAVAPGHAAGGDGLAAALRHLEGEMAADPDRLRQRGHLLPGVEALLQRLDTEPDVVQTVLTGNIAANAALKVSVFGLDRWLDLRAGAFGSDHHDRCALVPIARTRAERLHGHAPDVVWVLGDTPKDFACARAGGARCLLVATGRVPYEELAELPADAVVRDLSDLEAITTLLLD